MGSKRRASTAQRRQQMVHAGFNFLQYAYEDFEIVFLHESSSETKKIQIRARDSRVRLKAKTLRTISSRRTNY